MNTHSRQAILALEDGTVFAGIHFGIRGTATGEICFNTSMTGYQEILTDPSYKGQIVAMTYPLIGNYGITAEDNESGKAQVNGFVVTELSKIHSNWRATHSLADWLEQQGIVGIEGIDTRKLTKHLRSAGAMRACLTSELDPQNAVQEARKSPTMQGCDIVSTLDSAFMSPEEVEQLFPGIQFPPATHHVVAYDFGIKYNILKQLRMAGLAVTLVPADTNANCVQAMRPDGVFLSNGPGDPAALTEIHREISQIIGQIPIFGICLGHQIIAHALGAQTFKLKFGHRGANHPVQELASGKIHITSQNHGFAVDAATLPADVEITHINLNDNTVEGIAHKKHPVFGVQFHPEASPGPHDANELFQKFKKLVAQSSAQQ